MSYEEMEELKAWELDWVAALWEISPWEMAHGEVGQWKQPRGLSRGQSWHDTFLIRALGLKSLQSCFKLSFRKE